MFVLIQKDKQEPRGRSGQTNVTGRYYSMKETQRSGEDIVFDKLKTVHGVQNV